MPGLGSDQQNNRIAAVGEPKRASLADKPSLSRKDWAAGVMRDNIGLHLDVYVIAFMGIAFLGASFGLFHKNRKADPSDWKKRTSPLVSGCPFNG